MKVKEYYRLVLSVSGNTPNSYFAENFNSFDEAKEYWQQVRFEILLQKMNNLNK